jgi:glucosamine--fructose-6-phosphate aminotransferase (isomerizing)
MSTALYLSRFGYDARVADASELLYYEQIPTDAAIVLISRSGRTAEMVRLGRILNSAGKRYIAVTNEPDSEMAQLASATLPVAGESDNGVSIRTYTAAVLTLLHLGAGLTGNLKTLEGETARMLSNLERMIANWEADDTDLSRLTFFSFLGRGYSLGCAGEAALLFQELARRPAAWYNGAEFRQGPIEVLQPDHGVIVFAPDGPTRELNTALMRELEPTGAQVIEIGPGWAGIPEHMASITQMIPVQFMAYKLAAATPHRPGVFRFAAQTTESETKVAREQ